MPVVMQDQPPQVVDGGAFAYTALLVCYTDYL